MNFIFRLAQNLYTIETKSEIMSSACNKVDDDNLTGIVDFKFSFDKLELLQKELTVFLGRKESVGNRRILLYYQCVINFLKETCVENGLRYGYHLFNNLYPDERYELGTSLDDLFYFINSRGIKNHWFMSFLCSCDNFACLRQSEIFAFCEGRVEPRKVDSTVIDSLIKEVEKFLEEVFEKRARGSVNQVELTTHNPHPPPRTSVSRSSVNQVELTTHNPHPPPRTSVSRSSASRNPHPPPRTSVSRSSASRNN